MGKIAPDDYRHLVDQARHFLQGKSDEVKSELSRDMEIAAAEALDFEKAARLRDRIRALAHVQLQQGINPDTIDEADLFAAHQDGGHTCIQVFFFRSGQNWGNRAYFPKHDRGVDVEEVLDSFLAQFYDEREPPKLVIISHDIAESALLAEALSVKAERRVEVLVPQRGEKREVMAQAVMNARESLARRMAESATQIKLLEGVGEALGLDDAPRRIEVYDNSHIQGTNAVGAMIVAGPEGFIKGAYRKFNIKNADLTPGDDYGDDARGVDAAFQADDEGARRRSRRRGAGVRREGRRRRGRARQRARSGVDRRRRGAVGGGARRCSKRWALRA